MIYSCQIGQWDINLASEGVSKYKNNSISASFESQSSNSTRSIKHVMKIPLSILEISKKSLPLKFTLCWHASFYLRANNHWTPIPRTLYVLISYYYSYFIDGENEA